MGWNSSVVDPNMGWGNYVMVWAIYGFIVLSGATVAFLGINTQGFPFDRSLSVH